MQFLIREWLLLSSLTGLVLVSLYLGHLPRYTPLEFQVLFVLLVLFVIIKGLETSGLLKRLALKVERGRFVPLKLILATFFFSMIITNDVALILFVPLTLSLDLERKGLIVILEALAANAGSALTPIGNPQNLFIYWYYDLRPLVFIKTIAPFSLFFLGLLALIAMRIPGGGKQDQAAPPLETKGYFYLGALVVFVFAAMRLLPVSLGGIVLLFALFKDRKALHIDYALLATFFCLFGLTENLKVIVFSNLHHSEHVFLLAAALSQFISNVPAALVLAKLTSNWQALLWGVSVGGFGNLLGSLANLIAYRLFVKSKAAQQTSSHRFLLEFTLWGYAAFGLGILLFYLLQGF